MFSKKNRVYSEEKIAYARIIAYKLITFQLFFSLFVFIFLIFWTTLYCYPNNLNLWLYMNTPFNKPIATVITIILFWLIFSLVPSSYAAAKVKIKLTSPKYLGKYPFFVLICLPLGPLAYILLTVFKIKPKERFTSMATGFLKEAIDVKGLLGHIFDTLFPGTHKSHSIHGKEGDDKKYLKKQNKCPIKLDYLFMLAVLFQTKSPLVIDTPIKDDTLIDEESFDASTSRKKIRKLIKKTKKGIMDDIENTIGDDFTKRTNDEARTNVMHAAKDVTPEQAKRIKKMEKLAAKEQKKQEKFERKFKS